MLVYLLRNSLQGDSDVTKTGALKGLSAMAAAIAVTMLCYGAVAQEKKATTAPPAKTEKAKTDKAKTPSACKGLEEDACKAKATECSWIAATKTKTGQDRKAHCRSKPKTKAVKKEASKKE